MLYSTSALPFVARHRSNEFRTETPGSTAFSFIPLLVVLPSAPDSSFSNRSNVLNYHAWPGVRARGRTTLAATVNARAGLSCAAVRAARWRAAEPPRDRTAV